MPPRRSHKKSRAGCRRCKSRKIKCDEVHPRCGNCVKHGVGCDFENPDADDMSVVTTTSASSSSLGPPRPPSDAASTPPTLLVDFNLLATTPTISVASPATPSAFLSPSTPLYSNPSTAPIGTRSPTNRLLELRLMHQYTSMTSRTLVLNSSVTDDTWQNVVPRLACSGANYLADAMLAVAALHLRSLNPDDKELRRASHAYMASSLKAYCASLNGGIDERNAEPLFLTSTLISFQSSASRIFIRDDADPRDPASAYTLPLAWFHAFQGVKTVVASSWPWIRNSGAALSIIESQPVLQLDMQGDAPTSFFGHLLDDLDEELAKEDPVQAQTTRQSYEHAIAVLNWAHKLPHRGAALAFPATVSRRFLTLLEERRPRALAALACFFALLKSIESVWWLQGAARREVMGIVSQFEAASPWWSHLEWPVRIALYDGAVIPPDVWGADWIAEESKTEKGPFQLGETFVNHIEILAGMVPDPQDLPFPADMVLG